MMSERNEKDNLIDKLTLRTIIILILVGGMVWLGSMWAEERFGSAGSVGILLAGVILVTVAITLLVGTTFAKLYRAGVVDTIKGQQITQQGNTTAVVHVTRALRGEITSNAKAAAHTDILVEKRVHRMAQQEAKLLVDNQAQNRSAQSTAQQDEIDAQFWTVPANTEKIRYDQ
jgi:hypothetical protein